MARPSSQYVWNGPDRGFSVFSSPTGYGTAEADFARRDNFYNPPTSRLGLVPSVGVATRSPWGSLPVANPTGNVVNAPGGLPLLQTSKSDEGNAALRAALGQIGGLSNNATQPVHTTIKDPAQESRIGTVGDTVDQTNQANNQTLADFTRNFLAGDPEAKANQQQESAAIGKWYAPSSDPESVQAKLNAILNNARIARAGKLQQHLGAIIGGSHIGLGNHSSERDAIVADAVRRAVTDSALQDAEQQRMNYLTVAQAQPAYSNLRLRNLNDATSRGLVPLQASQQLLSGQINNLGLLGNIGAANRFQEDEISRQARILGLLGQHAAVLNADNIFGVGGQFPDQRFPPIQRNGYRPDFGPNGNYAGNYGGNGNYGANGLSPQIRQAYFAMTGKYPESDPQFNPQLLSYLQANPDAPEYAGFMAGIQPQLARQPRYVPNQPDWMGDMMGAEGWRPYAGDYA